MFDISQAICAPATSSGVLDYFLTLPQKGKVQAEYIWIGGSGRDIRSKTKTLTKQVRSLSDLPEWNFDGSSTGQADGHDSEVWLVPVKYVPDPFRKSPNILVLCECLDAKTMTPLKSNRRANARKIFDNPKVIKEETWWGIEQEYTMFEADGKTPLGWPRAGFPLPQGPYYCSVGARRAVGRSIVEAHYRACLYAEIDVSGINAEVMLGQWEYQVGPCVGIDSGDQLWISRYILERVSEMFGVVVSFDAKPIQGDWNGAGAHTNYSTKSMRALDPTHVSVTQTATLPEMINVGSKKKSARESLTPKSSKTSSTMKTFAEQKSIDDIATTGATVPSSINTMVSRSHKPEPLTPKLGPFLGYSAIIEAIEKLRLRHDEHMEVYGKDNKARLKGSHEASRYDVFSYGVANRGSSIRIPRMAEREGCGYFEDRRPSASCDPYDVTAIIAETTLLM